MANTASETEYRNGTEAHGKTRNGSVAIALADSYAYCESLARRSAGNFYYSFLTLPRDRFRSMCALYAFLRICDDLGDDPHASTAEKTRNLKSWREQLDQALRPPTERRKPETVGRRLEIGSAVAPRSLPTGELLTSRFDAAADRRPSHPVFPALTDVVQRYEMSRDYLFDVIDGVEGDLQPRGFETFDDLSQYCYQVAGAVGLCCLHIWGYTDDRAIPRAIDCGRAFQLTNILRDLQEDALMGRVYLPREDLERFGVTPADLAAGRRDENFHALMEFQVQRTREFYRKAGKLHDYLKPPGRPILSAMMKIYGGLLDEIVRRRYDVFSRRVSLSRWKKLRITFGAILKHRVLRLR